MQERTQPQETEVSFDPNCTVTVTPGEDIPNYPPEVGSQSIVDGQHAISQLTFNDLWNEPQYSITYGSITLFIQGVLPGGGRTWRIILNNTSGNSTIAIVSVQGNLATASNSARRDYVLRMVHRALEDSLFGKKVNEVYGPCK
ncbi:hypothetical protein CLV59_105473 [Chitinophaga dinghuensis]|uniref:Uncharacterized protein n=1 Tax=Chitinophaga dinghuensis TaxID=1539050 RepID=A0A327W036_9BACT|nr:hypothetical protein [Chitinophaga dinghuensis]RAJ80364.1 hypothetical protein CLV59_105473 [Chitinophaga dinghuensis]